MSFPTKFVVDFSSFRIDPKPHKYLSNAFNLPLSVQQNEVPGPEIENEDKEDIKNLFDFNQRLGACSSISKRDLQHPSFIFDRHSSQL